MIDKGDEYKQTALSIIGDSAIINAEDLKVLSDLKDELADTFLRAQVFRTRTEMEVSVLNDLKFPTPDAKYWQAVREQNVQFQELVMLSYEYRKTQIEMKKLRRKIEQEKDELERELLQVEIDKLTFIAKNQERTAKDRIREVHEWHEIKENLIPKMECGIEDVDRHQLFSYAKRFISQSKTAGGIGGPAEIINMQGQLLSALKTIKSRNLTWEFIKTFPTEQERNNLLREFNRIQIDKKGNVEVAEPKRKEIPHEVSRSQSK